MREGASDGVKAVELHELVGSGDQGQQYSVDVLVNTEHLVLGVNVVLEEENVFRGSKRNPNEGGGGGGVRY